MSDLRTAAQQALEALETCDAAHPSDNGQQWYDNKLVESAITTLRAALAEPVQEPITHLFGTIPVHDAPPKAEPVQVPPKWKLVPTEPTIGMCIAGDEARQNVDDLTRTPAIYRAMIAAAPAAPQQAEAVQEPVQESSDMAEQLADALDSAQFYRRRCEAIQAWQSKMRDPERTIVCDILANGKTLDPAFAGDRYTALRTALAEPLTNQCGETCERAKLCAVCARELSNE